MREKGNGLTVPTSRFKKLDKNKKWSFSAMGKNQWLQKKGVVWLMTWFLWAVGGCMLLNTLMSPIVLVNADDKGPFTPADFQALLDFLKETNPEYTSWTYDQLKQWFEDQTPKDKRWEVYPRLFPFCVTAEHIRDPSRTSDTDHLKHFEEIFEDIERVDEKFYNFDVKTHSTTQNKKWVEEITISRINTPEMDMVNLRQWVHVEVKMKRNMKGLYMQSIVGPMGLPFGEFNVDFPCVDDLQNTNNIDKIGQLSYCSYRPRTTIQHPSAYVAYDAAGREEFHMHYSWIDVSCLETPYVQFLMLVVEDFNYNATTKGNPKLGVNYQPLLSPVYLNLDFDSKSGAPFPYYPEWRDKMYCQLDSANFNSTYKSKYPGEKDPTDTQHLWGDIKNKYPSPAPGADAEFDKIKWDESTEVFRIQANEVYDSCLTGQLMDMSQRDEERLECPPGPFKCDTSYAGVKNVTADRVMLLENEKNVSNCLPCGAPACEKLGFPAYKCDSKPDLYKIQVNESTSLNDVEGIIQGSGHGIQATFAFLILIPLANFIARFYKEVSGHCLCDNGPWIFIHVGSHILSLLLMWISVGPVVPKILEYKEISRVCKATYEKKTDVAKCLTKESASNPHVPVALIAFMMQHCLVACGLWRSSNTKFRHIQVTLHSHFGYCCWILGAISTILAGIYKECNDVLVVSTLLSFTPFVFTAIGVALDCMTDKRVGIIPPRKQWPVLEAVKLEGRGPFTLYKWIVFGVYAAFMILLWLLMIGSSSALIARADKLFDEKKKSKITSLFGECSIHDEARKKATKQLAITPTTTAAP